MLDDPWLGCPNCGEEWQAPGERYVLGQPPTTPGPEQDAFIEAFIAALKGTDRTLGE